MLPHLDAAYNLARWLVGDASAAEDVVQDAVVRALGYFRTYRGGQARAWLLRIVRNTAYDAISTGKCNQTVSLEADDGLGAQTADLAPDPEIAFIRRERLERLDAALAALPHELRESLVLRELEQMSYKEIAFISGIPIGTVMSRLWRARRALIDLHAQDRAP